MTAYMSSNNCPKISSPLYRSLWNLNDDLSPISALNFRLQFQKSGISFYQYFIYSFSIITFVLIAKDFFFQFYNEDHHNINNPFTAFYGISS